MASTNRGRYRAGSAALPGFGACASCWPRRTDARTDLSVRRLRDEPNGVDLGPLEQAFPRRLATPDRRLHLAPPMFIADLGARGGARIAPPPEFVLIGRRHVRSNNSWLHNSHRLVKGKPRCTLQMHPLDAAVTGIVDGAIVHRALARGVGRSAGRSHAPT